MLTFIIYICSSKILQDAKLKNETKDNFSKCPLRLKCQFDIILIKGQYIDRMQQYQALHTHLNLKSHA